MNVFDEHLLSNLLTRLSAEGRIAFCASVCERLLPSFERFATEEAYGNAQILRRGVDLAWRCAQGHSVSEQELKEFTEQVEDIAPEPGDFDSDFASSALDAASAVGATLRCCETGEVAHCVEVAVYARDSVDMYIQIRGDISSEDPSLEEKIVAHPLMQREIERQLFALNMLERARAIDESIVTALKNLRGEGTLF